MNPESNDATWMAKAISLAELGEGSVEPNPMVGAVLVRDGVLIGEGWHQQFGGPHAEVFAIEQAGESSRGATLYVTLEPCCHKGKTPPCTQAILASGIKRVVVGARDPFPQVNGGGIAELKAAGISVALCEDVADAELAATCRALIAPFQKLTTQHRPWVIAKWAMTLDGKIAARDGSSHWITGEASRRKVHELRGRVDGIIVGRGTVLADDPALTARPHGPRVPLRIILDSYAALPLESQLVRTAKEVPVLVAASEAAPEPSVAALEAMGVEVVRLTSATRGERLQKLLDLLGKRQMTNVLVEGGGTLLGEMFDSQLVDEVYAFFGVKILGGADALSPIQGQGAASITSAFTLDHVTHEALENDLLIRGRIRCNETVIETET